MMHLFKIHYLLWSTWLQHWLVVLMGIDVYIPMWMQGVLGLNAAIGGLVLAPLSLVWMVGSFLASKWMTQMKTHWVLRIGLLIAAIGGAWLYLMPFRSNYLWFCYINGHRYRLRCDHDYLDCQCTK